MNKQKNWVQYPMYKVFDEYSEAKALAQKLENQPDSAWLYMYCAIPRLFQTRVRKYADGKFKVFVWHPCPQMMYEVILGHCGNYPTAYRKDERWKG